VFCNSSHSVVKSDKTCDLITFRFSYVMSRGDNSIPHKETRPVAEGLFRACLFGLSVAGCAWKAAVQEKLLFQVLVFDYLAGCLTIC
jgi:hypothetical protein